MGRESSPKAAIDGAHITPATVDTREVSNTMIFESEFQSAQAAINVAQANNIGYVFLQPRIINENLTVSEPLALIGQGMRNNKETLLSPESTSSITLSGRNCRILNCSYNSGDPAIRVEAGDCLVQNLNQRGADGNGIEVAGDRVIIHSIFRQGGANGDHIFFESGTTGGIVDQCTNTGNINDNGSNTIGTVS